MSFLDAPDDSARAFEREVAAEEEPRALEVAQVPIACAMLKRTRAAASASWPPVVGERRSAICQIGSFFFGARYRLRA